MLWLRAKVMYRWHWRFDFRTARWNVVSFWEDDD